MREIAEINNSVLHKSITKGDIDDLNTPESPSKMAFMKRDNLSNIRKDLAVNSSGKLNNNKIQLYNLCNLFDSIISFKGFEG